MGRVYYVTHPNVAIDPDVPVPEWGLSDTGRQRAERMLSQPWLETIERLVCSAEGKALETARLVADETGLDIEVREASGETDRSATGFVPHETHERLANQFFAEPDQSADGWERAVDAQGRIVACLEDVYAPGDESVLVIGHGAVGTLLKCHLAKLAISREHDQPGQGHYWVYDRHRQQVLHSWLPIEHAAPVDP